MEILQIISQSLTVVFLGIAAISDARSRKIPVILALSGVACGIILQLLNGRLRIYEILGGCIIGMIFLLIAKITGEAVGYGDGLILTATGAFLGIMNNVLLLVISLALAGIFSVIMLLAKKMKRKSNMPFIPFMLGGYVVMLAFF